MGQGEHGHICRDVFEEDGQSVGQGVGEAITPTLRFIVDTGVKAVSLRNQRTFFWPAGDADHAVCAFYAGDLADRSTDWASRGIDENGVAIAHLGELTDA